jgi:hypothetical protein
VPEETEQFDIPPAIELHCALETRNIRYIVVHQQLKVQQISNRPATPVTSLSSSHLAGKSPELSYQNRSKPSIRS